MLKQIAVAMSMVVLASGVAQAQGPITLELRGGGAFPTQDLGNAALKPGAGGEFNVSYGLLPHTHVYGGWSYHNFRTDEPFQGANYDVEDTGYVFGLAFRHPLARNIGGWVQGGGVVKHIELENSAGDIVADSGHELGWEVGGGLSIPLTGSIALTPGAKYRSFSADLTVGQTTTPVDLSYVTAEIGLAWTIGGRRGMAAVRR